MSDRPDPLADLAEHVRAYRRPAELPLPVGPDPVALWCGRCAAVFMTLFVLADAGALSAALLVFLWRLYRG
jgi:hypothetical protein